MQHTRQTLQTNPDVHEIYTPQAPKSGMYRLTRTLALLRTTLLTAEYTHEGHTDRVTITRSEAGWDVRQERDDTVVRRVNYSDWHRVERALQLFDLWPYDHSTKR